MTEIPEHTTFEFAAIAFVRSMIIPEQSSTLLYARHVEQSGMAFYSVACSEDLEGIVAKLKYGSYGEGAFASRIELPRWVERTWWSLRPQSGRLQVEEFRNIHFQAERQSK